MDYRPKLSWESQDDSNSILIKEEPPFSSAYELMISVLNQQLIKFNTLILSRIATDSVVCIVISYLNSNYLSNLI